MRNITRTFPGLGVAIASTATASALIVNPGFETGDLSGWTTDGAGWVFVGGADDPLIAPPLDDYGLPEGRHYVAVGGAGDNAYTTVSQTFAANAGQRLVGWVGFSIQPWGGDVFKGDAFARITSPSGADTLWTLDYDGMLGIVGTPFGVSVDYLSQLWYSAGWLQWNYTAAENGTYTLTYGCRTDRDKNWTFATFDSASVPDTTNTLFALILGLFGLAGFVRSCGCVAK